MTKMESGSMIGSTCKHSLILVMDWYPNMVLAWHSSNNLHWTGSRRHKLRRRLDRFVRRYQRLQYRLALKMLTSIPKGLREMLSLTISTVPDTCRVYKYVDVSYMIHVCPKY